MEGSWCVKPDHPDKEGYGVRALRNEEQWVGRRMTATSYTGGLCSVQIAGAGLVGRNVSATGVYSVETWQMYDLFVNASTKICLGA